jgi:hypothetical protein
MSRTSIDVGRMLVVFAAVTAIAAALGAANFGTALTFGEIAFAITVVWTIVRD